MEHNIPKPHQNQPKNTVSPIKSGNRVTLKCNWYPLQCAPPLSHQDAKNRHPLIEFSAHLLNFAGQKWCFLAISGSRGAKVGGLAHPPLMDPRNPLKGDGAL